MTDPSWYRAVDFEEGNGRGYVLTENAPQEAIDSYNEFYADEDSDEGEID